jgi:hypothetical protein
VKVSNSFFSNILATVVFMLPLLAAGQQFARVYTAKGEPVEDAIIVYHPVGLKSFQKVAITNSNGKAAIEANNAIELIISKMGFTTLRDTLAKGENKTYTLVQNDVNLKDVVVTGQFEANYCSKGRTTNQGYRSQTYRTARCC